METKIEWTDETWNPVTGCVKVSPGCKHCYAETFAERFRGTVSPSGRLHPFHPGFDPTLRPERLEHVDGGVARHDRSRRRAPAAATAPLAIAA